MDPRIIATAAKVGNLVESVLAAFRPGRNGNAVRALRIVAHRSLGDATTLTVCGQVVREAPTSTRRLQRAGAIPAREHLASVYRAFDVEEVPHALLDVYCASVQVMAHCDARGFFCVDLPAPRGQPWASGRHLPTVIVCHPPDSDEVEEGGASGDRHQSALRYDPTPVVCDDFEVFVPGVSATLAIVSDLDDTAMDTNTLSTCASIATVMFRSARNRDAVPGVPALYNALQAGPCEDSHNPVCYISSGAWNLYHTVVAYLDTHDMPPGSILLNDWGSRRRGFHAVGHAHKSQHVRSLLARLPSLPFLLIGDDVQEDPEIYCEVAREHPGRIAAVWIRETRHDNTRRRAIESLRLPLALVGTDLVVAKETAHFAEDAARRRWIAPAYDVTTAATR